MHTVGAMRIAMATQDASTKYFKESVVEEMPGMLAGLCDTAKVLYLMSPYDANARCQ